MESRKVVVIGAGNGGISAAVALAQQGYEPLVLEKHRLPGGCASSFVRGRFEFDVSLHALFYTFRGFEDIWEKHMGIKADLAQVQSGVAYSHIDENGKPVFIQYPHGDEGFTEEFKKRFPEDADKMDEFMGLCRQLKTAITIMSGDGIKMEKSLSPLNGLKKKFKMLGKILKVKKQAPDFLTIAKMTTEEVMDAYNMPNSIRRYVSTLWWYMGDEYKKIPFPHLGGSFYFPIEIPCFYPVNTAHEYLMAMEKKIRDLGGEIRYNTEVSEILTENGKIVGVKTADGQTIKTNNIVSNASPRLVLDKMIHDENPKRKELLRAANEIATNGSFVTVYLGLNKSCEELGIENHHIYFTDHDDGTKTWEASNTLEGPFSFGSLCPNVTIPDFSPEGTCVLTFTMGMTKNGFEGLSQNEYKKAKIKLANDLLDRACYHMGMDLREYIEEIEVMTPVTLSRYGNLEGGSLGFSVGKPDNTAVKELVAHAAEAYKGLTFVGQYARNAIGYSNTVAGYQDGWHKALEMKKEGK